MLRAGIPMREIDETDLARYLRVMAYISEHHEEKPPAAQAPDKSGSGGEVIELRRGTIDQFWG